MAGGKPASPHPHSGRRQSMRDRQRTLGKASRTGWRMQAAEVEALDQARERLS